jgi:N-acetylmuramoyl-L-alanine amidase
MRIGINCGHTITGAGSGAVGILNESIETRNVGYALIDILRKRGVEVVDCTVNTAPSQAIYLNETVKMANATALDYFISIHFNAAENKTANGTEVFTRGAERFAQAVAIERVLVGLGFRSRGIKNGSNLSVVSRTKAPAMLVEVCFVNGADAELYKRIGALAVARQIANVFVAEVTKPVFIKDGWHKEDGDLWYYYKDEHRVCGWLEDKGHWYWLQPHMVAYNWICNKSDGKWYFLDPTGKMVANDWASWKDKWYYLGSDGAMLTNTTTPDGYRVGADGAWIE